MKYLEIVDLKEINEQMIRLTNGGLFVKASDNVHDENALGYLVDIVKSEYLPEDIDERIPIVASYYAYNIIMNHIFIDGNKRTGMMAALHFLGINGYKISSPDEEEIRDMALSIATGEVEREQLAEWFRTIVDS